VFTLGWTFLISEKGSGGGITRNTQQLRGYFMSPQCCGPRGPIEICFFYMSLLSIFFSFYIKSEIV